MNNEQKDNKNEFNEDGEIKENTGFIPIWFSILFFGSIIIGLCYAGYYHYMIENSQKKEYAADVAGFEKANPTSTIGLNKEGGNPLRGQSEAIIAGEKSFAAICAACHKADATGLVGPSLVDKVWLHGSTEKELFTVIMEGVSAENIKQNPPKGIMPPHKASLGAQKVLEIMAWLAEKNKSIK